MSDLRNHLFETLEALKDEDKPMNLETAQMVCKVAGTLIETAKVEVDFIKVTGLRDSSEFFEEPLQSPMRPQLAANGSIPVKGTVR